MLRAAIVLLLTAPLAACGDDIQPIGIEIDAPTRANHVEASEVVVRGLVTGGRGVSRVSINGRDVEVANDRSFEAVVPLEPGTNVIASTAHGLFGEQATDRRSVVSGIRSSEPVDGGVLLRYGVRGVSNAAEKLRPTVDIDSVYAALKAAPLNDSGVGCTREVVTATAVATPVDQLFMYSIGGAFGGEVLFSPMDVTAVANYADSNCLDQVGGVFRFETLELHWTYELDVNLDGADISVALVESNSFYDHEFIYTNESIEPASFSRVATDLHLPLQAALVAESTSRIEAATVAWLGELNATENIEIGGISYETTSKLSQLDAGGESELAMTITTSLAPAEAAQYVPTPAAAILPRGSDAAVAIADDALNQAFAAAWANGGFDSDSGATLELLAPLALRAREGEPLEVTVGDWSFRDGDVELTFSGSAVLVADDDPVHLRLRADSASLHAQLLAGDPTEAELQAIIVATEALLVARLSEVVASVSVPVADVAATKVVASGKNGHVEIGGDLSE